MFFDSAHGTSCTGGFPATGFTSAVQVNVPPVVQPGFPPIPSQCAVGTGNPDNCVQVVVFSKVTNYLMGIFGQPSEYLEAVATAYDAPGNAGGGGGTSLPPSYGVNLYQPASGCTGQCYTPTSALSKGPLACTGAGKNCPTLWTGAVNSDGNGATDVTIRGLDGTKLTPNAHVTAVQSAGHVVDQTSNLIFCDGYNTPSCAGGSVGAGSKDYALGATARQYCSGVTAGTPSNACTNANPPGGLGQITGSSTAYSATSWTPPAPRVPVNDCGGLILNGDAITAANSPAVFFNANGSAMSAGSIPAACVPGSNEPYSVMPGKYRYIVINHGVYNFNSGLFYVYGQAPVNTVLVSGSQEANGIDHSQELSGVTNDWDLCPNSSAGTTAVSTTVCPTLTAGIWIGQGLPCDPNTNKCGTYTYGTATTCSNGTVTSGTVGGGGQYSYVTGTGVSFYFGSGSAGFVSTKEVIGLSLTAPAVGALTAVGGEPMLINQQNNAWTHLDSYAFTYYPTSFRGLIYQTSSATAGGVDIDPGMGNGNALGNAALSGQIVAYSLDFFGTAGPAVDFSSGWGTGQPVGAGNNESSIVTIPSNALTPVGTTAEKLTINYQDEWAMDAYDISIQLNGSTTYYFSKPLWSIAPNTAPTGGPYPPQNGYTPSDANPRYMSSAQGSPAYAPPSPYVAGSGTNEYTLHTHTGYADDTIWDVSGDWVWGNHSNLAGGARGTYNATIAYTFPTPPGQTVSVLVHAVDGDHCGDYDDTAVTLNNVTGSGGGGLATTGSSQLVQ